MVSSLCHVKATLAVLAAIICTSTYLVAGCGVWGQLFCDKCWDGRYASGDPYISGASVSANCSVVKGTGASQQTVYFWGTDSSTDSSGNFQAAITGASNKFGKSSAEAAFMWVLFKNSDFTQGQLSDAYLVGCTISVTKSTNCPTLALNDGSFLSNGASGNGWTSSNVGLRRYQNSAAADIYVLNAGSLTNSVSMTPTAKDKSCPATPPPSPPPPGIKGDPHFSGADGSHYDFSGVPDTHYCIVSDAHVHINAYYGGRFDQWGEVANKPLTWIRKMGILWGDHKIALSVREGARWQYDSGYMAKMEVDGVEVKLANEGDFATFANGGIELRWLAARVKNADDLVDVYMVKVKGAFTMRLTLRPEIELLRTAEDGVVHIDFELPEAEFSSNAHGVLGQTFRLDRKNKLSEQQLTYSELLHTNVVSGDNAEGFLDGTIENYRASGLLVPDCGVSHFVGATARDGEKARIVELASGSVTSTMGWSRRMLQKSHATAK